ncbi:MAG: ABC transporter permease, partial [Dongia sp.]
MSRAFSLGRFAAVFTKEFVQMRRDRITFGMMIGVPLLQLVLFGFAINSDPKHLPAVLVMGEDSIFARSIVSTIEHTDYIR